MSISSVASLRPAAIAVTDGRVCGRRPAVGLGDCVCGRRLAVGLAEVVRGRRPAVGLADKAGAAGREGAPLARAWAAGVASRHLADYAPASSSIYPFAPAATTEPARRIRNPRAEGWTLAPVERVMPGVVCWGDFPPL